MQAIILLGLVAVAAAASINNSELPPLVHPKDDNTPIGRIVGGNQATSGQFPYQGLLRVNGGFTCGCSILSNRWILTAAHCVGSNPSAYTVLVGTINANGQGGTVYQAQRIIAHENYGNFMNDIALIQVSQNIALGGNVQTIQRATSLPAVGTSHILSGWGRTSNGGAVSQTLKWVNSSLQSAQVCSSRTGINHPGTICFYNAVNQGVCNGDSGGPAAQNGRLVGVTNFVVGGCAAGNPDGYASVVNYNSWIDRNMALYADDE